jgi:phosphoribosyl-AMP cyclohydrolase
MKIAWNQEGLIPVIAQDYHSREVLMLAWMNEEALQATFKSGFATYFSRSRQKLWQKGEQSGHQQKVVEVRLDCDGDTLLLLVEQKGGIACHTGRRTCFYQAWKNEDWQTVEPVLKDPAELYSQ